MKYLGETLLILSSIVLTVSTVYSSVEADESVRIGIVNDQSKYSEYVPLLEYLNSGSELGFDVVLFPDYEALYFATQEARVRLAVFQWINYVRIRDEMDLSVLVKGRDEISVFVVRESSNIFSIQDLRGRSIALGLEGSLTSDLIPRMVLM